jgi:uncharacterized protein (TIGR02300 family)
MTKKLQKKIVKKSETKKAESPKKSESGKKAENSSRSVKPSSKKSPPPIAESGGLGKKHTCYSCNVKFYDLGKEEKLCPKCGADQNSRPAIKVKVPRSAPKLSEFDVVDEDVVAELSGDEDTILETDSDGDDPEPILDEDES